MELREEIEMDKTFNCPAEGTIGFGAGEYKDFGDGPEFFSTVWFAADCENDAREFAAQFGYEVKEGVAL